MSAPALVADFGIALVASKGGRQLPAQLSTARTELPSPQARLQSRAAQ